VTPHATRLIDPKCARVVGSKNTPDPTKLPVTREVKGQKPIF
jgi:hypothetical protein